MVSYQFRSTRCPYHHTTKVFQHASSQPSSAAIKENEAQWLWKQALNIDINDIIYLHLHQKDEFSGAKLTLVDCEGVQSPPLQLPVGTCAVALLGALENALAPTLRLDPPLWISETKEKILPRLRKRSTAATVLFMDYVFRIVRNNNIHAVPEPASPPVNGDYEKWFGSHHILCLTDIFQYLTAQLSLHNG